MGRLDFDGPPAPAPEPQSPHRIMRGTYQCQHCNLIVRQAEYNREASELMWSCPDGHKSVIVGFSI